MSCVAVVSADFTAFTVSGGCAPNAHMCTSIPASLESVNPVDQPYRALQMHVLILLLLLFQVDVHSMCTCAHRILHH